MTYRTEVGSGLRRNDEPADANLGARPRRGPGLSLEDEENSQNQPLDLHDPFQC